MTHALGVSRPCILEVRDPSKLRSPIYAKALIHEEYESRIQNLHQSHGLSSTHECLLNSDEKIRPQILKNHNCFRDQIIHYWISRHQRLAADQST